MEASWDDLKLFLIVAEGGGLSAAAARTGLSAPTIGRRMQALERTMNRLLFERSRRGYVLAKDGEILLDRVREMQKLSHEIHEWHGGAFRDPYAEIAGDAWLAIFFTQHGDTLSKGPGDIRAGYTEFHEVTQLLNRDRLILVTAAPPTSGNYAVLPTVLTCYSVYQSTSFKGRSDVPWVSIGKETSRLPSDRWVYEQYDQGIYSWTNKAHLLLHLIASAQGRGVLPCFVGDGRGDLMRDGGVIDELTTRLYIVVNDDDRRRPEVRQMIDRVAGLLDAHADLFAGKCEAGWFRQTVSKIGTDMPV